MKGIKKVTPKGDLSWCIKWAAAFFYSNRLNV